MINNPQAYASNETKATHHHCEKKAHVLCDVHSRRRSGLIVNKSKHTLYIYLGKLPPINPADWLSIPHFANADLPFMYIGKVWGYWDGVDSNGVTIHEFYGDF